jgi:hypothetical protein
MPILTIFTLTNFTLVFLSCIITIFILRLYYTPANYRQVRRLPYIIRLIVLKYVSYLVCSNYHYNEENDIEVIIDNTHKFNDDKIVYTLNEKKNTVERKKTIEMEIVSVNNHHSTTTKMKTTIRRRKYNLVKTNNEELALNLLSTLKSLKKKLIDNNNKLNEINNSLTTNLKLVNETNNLKYKEEWKQAALIIDRMFFYIFLIAMPLTLTVFFKTNFIEYITSSNKKVDSNVPNEC